MQGAVMFKAGSYRQVIGLNILNLRGDYRGDCRGTTIIRSIW